MNHIKTWRERIKEYYEFSKFGSQSGVGVRENVLFRDEEIADLRAEIDRLTAALETDKLDAERYRWLREYRDIPAGKRNMPWVVAL